jgi:hypothetical protein
MTRSLLGIALLVATLLAAAPAAAVIGTADEVPAATLLLPYFEVDFNDAGGVTTVLSVTNARQHPVIAHFTLWTDWSVATLDFNAYLTGFDVLEIDLRNLFAQGTVPGTSHNNPAISPVGAFSQTVSPSTGVGPGVASCDAQLPLPGLPLFLLGHIQTAHTGQASAIFGGACSGSDRGDSVARGYITIDNVHLCTLDFPSDGGYFLNGGAGTASNENVLLGSYRIINPNAGTGFAGPMVHLEASSDDPRTGPGDYTFYARYSGGADNREPLATTFFAPFSSDDTELIVWRDTKLRGSPTGCGFSPSWVPLDQSQVVVFDQEENPELPTAAPGTLLPFPLASTRVKVGSSEFPTATSAGWIFINLDVDTGGLPAFGATAQAWMTVVSPFGLGVAQEAFALDNASAPSGATLPCTVEGAPCGDGPDGSVAVSRTANGGSQTPREGGSDR